MNFCMLKFDGSGKPECFIQLLKIVCILKVADYLSSSDAVFAMILGKFYKVTLNYMQQDISDQLTEKTKTMFFRVRKIN